MRLIKSFSRAGRGLLLTYKEEKNFQIHCLVAVVAILLGFWLHISNSEWLSLLIVIIIVLSLEMVNSIVERVLDIIKPSVNQYIKDLKDIMAATVLLAAIGSVIVGLIIFLPKILVSGF